jgi:hypothetical protein
MNPSLYPYIECDHEAVGCCARIRIFKEVIRIRGSNRITVRILLLFLLFSSVAFKGANKKMFAYYSPNVQGGSDKSGILQICFQNGTAQLKIIRF